MPVNSDRKNTLPHTIVARCYHDNTLRRVAIANGIYQSIESVGTSSDSTLPWIAPGLVDPQINGFGGVDFNRAPGDEHSLAKADQTLAACGCTHYLITFITNIQNRYEELFNAWEAQRQTSALGAMGYHLEGPFLNPDPSYRGAHQSDYMIAPNLDFLTICQRLSHQNIKLMTLAPEVDWPESLSFIQEAVNRGVRLSVGHSSLMGDPLKQSIQAGLSCWTHLGNAAPGNCHKFENVVLHALASELPHVSLIPDGLHLPPHAFRALTRALGDRLILTTDAIAGTATSLKASSLGELNVEIQEDGRAMSGNRMAGSTLRPFDGVFRAAQMSGLPWFECWDAFSTRTAAWLGVPHGFEVGKEATFCLFEVQPTPKLRETWRKGIKVF